jgi:hypothetical protein
MSVVQGIISYQNEPKYYNHAPNDIANVNPESTLMKKEIVNNKKIQFLICVDHVFGVRHTLTT